MRMILIAALSLAFLAIGHAEEKQVPKELQPLQGKWKGLKMTVGGKETDKLPSEFLEFDGNMMYELNEGKRMIARTMTVDVTKTPHMFDLAEDAKAETFGIWKLKKDKLTLCFVHHSEAKDRPTKFESPKGSESVLIELEKVK